MMEDRTDIEAARWNGDEWRWRLGDGDVHTRHSVYVIEPPKGAARPEGRRTIPFGFGIREPECEWEGNPS